MKVVFDTNIIISRYISPQSTPATLLRWWRKEAFDLLVSEAILQEYQEVLNYSRVLKYTHMTPGAIQQVIRNFRQFAILVEPTEEVNVVERDADDNKFIACALAGGAEIVVSGDDDLLEIKTYRGIRILSPAAFLAFLEGNKEKAA